MTQLQGNDANQSSTPVDEISVDASSGVAGSGSNSNLDVNTTNNQNEAGAGDA